MRTLVVVALVLALAFAGCVTKKSEDDDGAGTATSTQSGTATTSRTTTNGGTSSPGTAVNRAPTASMNANNTGTAPVNVTFTIDGADADNDTLSWSLGFGDNSTAANGTSLPANVTHLYAAAGAYNASLSVSDGTNTTVVTLVLNISAGIPFDQFVASGTPDLACPQCSAAGANTGAGYRAGINEMDSWFVEIPAGAVGQPFTLESESTNPDMVFRTSCASSGAAIGESFVGDGSEAGVVPADAVCVLAWNPDDVVAKITLTIG